MASEAQKLNKTRRVSAISSKPAYIRKLKTKIENQVEATITDAILNPSDWGEGWGTTLRRNGEVVTGGFRDIFDLGFLFISIGYEWRGMSLHITSDCPYIEAILTGFDYTNAKGQTTTVPGRNFLDLKGVKLG